VFFSFGDKPQKMNYAFILAIFPTSFLPNVLYPYLPKILYSYLPFTFQDKTLYFQPKLNELQARTSSDWFITVAMDGIILLAVEVY